jgi:hypothetical protein
VLLVDCCIVMETMDLHCTSFVATSGSSFAIVDG